MIFSRKANYSMLLSSMRRYLETYYLNAHLSSHVHTMTTLDSPQGARFVEYNSVFPDGDGKAEAKSLRNSLKLNDAACKLKLNSFPEVVELTTKVPDSEPLNRATLFLPRGSDTIANWYRFWKQIL